MQIDDINIIKKRVDYKYFDKIIFKYRDLRDKNKGLRIKQP
jgi:hypothetical protein